MSIQPKEIWEAIKKHWLDWLATGGVLGLVVTLGNQAVNYYLRFQRLDENLRGVLENVLYLDHPEDVSVTDGSTMSERMEYLKLILKEKHPELWKLYEDQMPRELSSYRWPQDWTNTIKTIERLEKRKHQDKYVLVDLSRKSSLLAQEGNSYQSIFASSALLMMMNPPAYLDARHVADSNGDKIQYFISQKKDPNLGKYPYLDLSDPKVQNALKQTSKFGEIPKKGYLYPALHELSNVKIEGQ